MHKNIIRVGYTLGTDLPFCHLCMTAVHEAKWLSSTKKARPSLPYQVFCLQEGSNCRFEEVRSYSYSQCHKEVNKAIHLLSQQVSNIAR